MERPSVEKRLLKWQCLVIGTAFLAYMLHYFCKVHLYVVLNDFKEYLNPHNPKKADEYNGIMIAVGYVGYASGKLLLGIFVDSYLRSAVKAILITLVFAPLFSILFAILSFDNELLRVVTACTLWFGIRFVIASAWIGLVKLVSYWIPPTYHGRVMAFCNLSWLFGDSIARELLGHVYEWGNNSWRFVFYVSAIITAFAIIPTVILIRDTPSHRGLPAIDETADNVYAKEHKEFQEEQKKISKAKENVETDTVQPINVLSMNEDDEIMLNKDVPQQSFCAILNPLLKDPLFLMVLIMNFQYLFIRELYNVFFIAYLEDEIGMTKDWASSISGIVPFIGSVSVVIAGVWVDNIKAKHWRLSLIPIFAVFTMVCLSCLALIDPKQLKTEMIIVLVVIFGLSLYGPYSLMSGVLAVDIGGQVSSAMVSGFISAAGYSAGIVVGIISSLFTYQFMWFISTCCAGGIVLTGVVLFFYNRRLWIKNRSDLYKNIMDQDETLGKRLI